MNNPEYKDLPAEQKQKLEGFRKQIDDLDDKLIELFTQRIEIVSQVGKMKRGVNPDQCPLRPGREADMVRRIADKFEGTGFSPAAATTMWRTLIGASTAVENDLTISVYTPEGDSTLYWEAREYFGPFLNIIRHPHINRVIGDVMDGVAAVGLLPELNSSDETHWWSKLLGSGSTMPSIFACVPFVHHEVPGRRNLTSMAIGHIKPEATAEDISLLVLEADHNVSQHKLQSAFAESTLDAQWLNTHTIQPDRRHHLIELKGFITRDNEAIHAIEEQLGRAIIQLTFLGSYAAPMTLQFTANRESA